MIKIEKEGKYMGKKIFVSYKYADDFVENLEDEVNSTVRDYVDLFEQKLDEEDDIYKNTYLDTLFSVTELFFYLPLAIVSAAVIWIAFI